MFKSMKMKTKSSTWKAYSLSRASFTEWILSWFLGPHSHVTPSLSHTHTYTMCVCVYVNHCAYRITRQLYTYIHIKSGDIYTHTHTVKTYIHVCVCAFAFAQMHVYIHNHKYTINQKHTHHIDTEDLKLIQLMSTRIHVKPYLQLILVQQRHTALISQGKLPHSPRICQWKSSQNKQVHTLDANMHSYMTTQTNGTYNKPARDT